MSDLVSDLFCRVPADFLQRKQPVLFGGTFLKALTTDYLALTDEAVRELVNKTCDEFDSNTQNLVTARVTLGHEDGGVVDTIRVLGLKLLSSKISNWQIARLELASCSPNVSKSDVAKRVSLTIATLARDVVSEVSELKFIVLFAHRSIFTGTNILYCCFRCSTPRQFYKISSPLTFPSLARMFALSSLLPSSISPLGCS